MEAIASLVSYISSFFDLVALFFSETLPQMIKDAMAWFLITATVSYIEFKIWSLQFGWSIASSVLDAFNVGPLISGYITQLSPNVAYLANVIGIFDALNIVIQAGVSSWILKLMRF